MKKQTFQKFITLKKKTVSELNKKSASEIKGGGPGWWTAGCTDGCGSGVFQTSLRCSFADCTNNCNCM